MDSVTEMLKEDIQRLGVEGKAVPPLQRVPFVHALYRDIPSACRLNWKFLTDEMSTSLYHLDERRLPWCVYRNVVIDGVIAHSGNVDFAHDMEEVPYTTT